MMNALKQYSFNAAKANGESFAARRNLVIVGGIALAVSLIFIELVSIITVVAVLSIRLSVVVLGKRKMLIGPSL